MVGQFASLQVPSTPLCSATWSCWWSKQLLGVLHAYARVRLVRAARAGRQQTSSCFDASTRPCEHTMLCGTCAHGTPTRHAAPTCHMHSTPKGRLLTVFSCPWAKVVLMALVAQHAETYGRAWWACRLCSDVKKKSYAFMAPKTAGMKYTLRKRRQYK